MKFVIYKYELSNHEVNLNLPINHEILKCGIQNNKIFIWIKINQDINMYKNRKFFIFGTGEKFTHKDLTYIDTLFMDPGLVWHIFSETIYY